MYLSKRILDMQFSPIRKLAPYAEEARKKGTKVYPLNIGQPDIATPEPFFQGIRSFSESVLKYSGSSGVDSLIDSFRKYYRKLNIDLEKDEILVTNGGSEALLFSLMTICDAGDEVIIPEPFYTNYNGFAEAAGVKVVPFLTKAEDGFHLPKKEVILDKITEKTKAILVTNPGNPTGTVYTYEEMRMLGDIVKENNICLIADEVYREFVYDNIKHTSAMYLKDILDRIIVIDSVSKRYSACGARVGMIGSKNKEIIRQALKLCQSRLCVPTIEQLACANLINTPDSYFIEVKTEYEKRRNILYDALKKMPGVICEKPSGAFYIVVKLPVEDSEDFAKWILTDFNYAGRTVMFAPAGGFYATPGLGKNEIRLSYCLNSDDLKDAMEILSIALKEYNKIN